MSSRDAILSRIRDALAGDEPRPLPPVSEVWPRENPPVEKLVARFVEELEAVDGEVHRPATMAEARKKLAELLDALDAPVLGVADHQLAREVSGELPPQRLATGAHADPPTLAQLPAAVVAAEMLLADTGTCMVACPTPHHRLICYLPPVCIIVAKVEQLVEHMPAAWEKIAPRVADPELRGEFVFITGPSRTADIEKILILGVHGPKRVIVLLVG